MAALSRIIEQPFDEQELRQIEQELRQIEKSVNQFTAKLHPSELKRRRRKRSVVVHSR